MVSWLVGLGLGTKLNPLFNILLFDRLIILFSVFCFWIALNSCFFVLYLFPFWFRFFCKCVISFCLDIVIFCCCSFGSVGSSLGCVWVG